jgi:prevent-host-death family protein
MCYGRRMSDVASRELRNNTRSVLARVESGESITITVDGRPVATLEPIRRGRPWITREEYLRDIVPHRADRGLLSDLREMMPDTTDDLPWG